MNLDHLLSSIPSGLREPLIAEYKSITQNYFEHRWAPSELSGGKFCEIVYSILDGLGKGTFAETPFKPGNFVDACKRLENYSLLPRSFQILIPRMLPSLYEIRNNRSVGHVGGDVDPNSMDATAVVQIAGWIMGELVRVLHTTSVLEAEKAINFLTERKTPLVWQSVEGLKRVLNPKISIPDQILLLISSSSNKTDINDLNEWLDYKNKGYIKKLLSTLHYKRYIEYNTKTNSVELLSPGATYLETRIEKMKITL
ncbi:hypothetical protein [Pedobacter sp.]|uniref:hypothetical protein n=1 Tax=Pedobacter sp. TaxID=1411316 RepID=UPI0031D73673